uniref:DUF1376 domain-containing protein n=1 Tax=Steinernema glaseri TaxID=37863 RepID=A0A1I7Z7L1_9BILA
MCQEAIDAEIYDFCADGYGMAWKEWRMAGPEVTLGLTVQTDEITIYLWLRNLLRNAFKMYKKVDNERDALLDRRDRGWSATKRGGRLPSADGHASDARGQSHFAACKKRAAEKATRDEELFTPPERGPFLQ